MLRAGASRGLFSRDGRGRSHSRNCQPHHCQAGLCQITDHRRIRKPDHNPGQDSRPLGLRSCNEPETAATEKEKSSPAGPLTDTALSSRSPRLPAEEGGPRLCPGAVRRSKGTGMSLTHGLYKQNYEQILWQKARGQGVKNRGHPTSSAGSVPT